MSNHHSGFGFLEYGHGRRCNGRVLSIVAVSLVGASGCGSGLSAFLPQASVEIIRGKDSAGAIVELEKHGADLLRARVIDVVLGTAEANIISSDDSSVEFAIRFPAGVTITYIGRYDGISAPDNVKLSGQWHQHPGGIFGADFGTWEAQSHTKDG